LQTDEAECLLWIEGGLIVYPFIF